MPQQVTLLASLQSASTTVEWSDNQLVDAVKRVNCSEVWEPLAISFKDV
jgi:hypothetical protein